MLVWVRGDTIEDVRRRLAAIAQNPGARRFERTTTVPLIDTLLPTLGVSTGFLLAIQIRGGNLDVDALVLPEAAPPREAEKSLAFRYRPNSDRYRAAAAALAYLKADGVALNRVVLAAQTVTSLKRKPQVELSFNAFLIYQVASSNPGNGWRHLHVWPTRRDGRWLALELQVKNSRAMQDLYWNTHRTQAQQDRYGSMRQALGMPPLDLAAVGAQETPPADAPTAPG